MTPLRIAFEFDPDEPTVQPAADVRGTVHLDRLGDQKLRAVECSTMWYTVGKGDEDVYVADLERFEDVQPVDAAGVTLPVRLSVPHSPRSYDGVIVKIRWCVRTRAFLEGGETVVHDEPFELGETIAGKLAEPISELSGHAITQT